MFYSLLKYLKRKIGLIILIHLFIFFILYDFPWDNTVDDIFLNIQYKVRGTRQVSDKIALLFISAEDIQTLNGWPISRDYYGYATYILNQLGAKVIGYDILFDTEDKRYPEYDETLVDFMNSYKNVCLPMVFTEVHRNKISKIDSSDVTFYKGQYPVFPADKFKNNAAGIGFSNISDETIINRVPVIISYQDTFVCSFGFELARLYLQMDNIFPDVKSRKIHMSNTAGFRFSFPVDRNGNFYLNHFGRSDNIKAVNFLDLLRDYNENRDTIDLNGKVAILAVTAPGYSSLKTTPLASAIPSVFIHVTTAENMIERNFLHVLPDLYQLLSMSLLILSLVIIFKIRKLYLRIITFIIVLIINFIFIMFLFTYLDMVLHVFYPTMAFISVFLYAGIIEKIHIQREKILERKMLQSHIDEKQKILSQTEQKLEQLNRDFKNELKKKELLSQDYYLQIQENKNRVLELEKQIRDLQSFIIVDKKNVTLDITEFIYAEDSSMVQVLELLRKVSSDDIAVLITGETGTGKELAARAIHKLSIRKNKSFVAVNCGALSETLLESELFGHEKGSFTGAHAQRRGRFELADGGTIFLDEITETSLSFQAKLLRTLQEKTIERIGSEKTINIDVRIISATGKNVENEIKEGRFRKDLFYRLQGFPVFLPPLRERKNDIPLLILHFLTKYGYKTIRKCSDQAMEHLIGYKWPGNVRELENVVRRCAILTQSEGRDMIQIDDLPKEIIQQSSSDITYQPIDQQILELLRSLHFKHSAISGTAKILGNRDRGTITEYLRGICFEYLVNSRFNPDIAVEKISESTNPDIQKRVKDKLKEYLRNLDIHESVSVEENEQLLSSPQFKGLPKKYHPYLLKIIKYFSKEIDAYHATIDHG